MSAVAVESQAAIFRKERLAARTSPNPCMSFVQTADGNVLGNALLENPISLSQVRKFMLLFCVPQNTVAQNTPDPTEGERTAKPHLRKWLRGEIPTQGWSATRLGWQTVAPRLIPAAAARPDREFLLANLT